MSSLESDPAAEIATERGFIAAAVRHPVTTLSSLFFLILFGIIGLLKLPIQLTPTIDRPVITISTSYPGAAPLEVEQQVTNPIEEKVNSVERLRKVRSSSREGRSVISLEFDWGVDKDLAVIDVMRKVNQVSGLPEESEQPVITAASSDEEQPILYVAVLSELDVSHVREIIDRDVQPRLLRIEGVGDVGFNGGQEREVRVTLDPGRLAAHGVSIAMVREAIIARNRNISAGEVEAGEKRWIVRTTGEYVTLDEIAATPVVERNGGFVRVRDVGEVSMSFKDPDSRVRLDGVPGNVLFVNKKAGANTIEVDRGVDAALDELNREFAPRGIRLAKIRSDTEYIWDAVKKVVTSLVVGSLLAVSILYFFLGSFRLVAVIGSAIPIALTGTFAFLWACDRSVNIISIAGLGFAGGMVLDNAVVVLENIVRHCEMGKSPFKAAVEGAREVWGAVIASTATTLAVFIPVLFVEEEAGQLFRDIAYAISFAIALSLLLSVTIIPCFGARVLKARGGTFLPAASIHRRRILEAAARLGSGFLSLLSRFLDGVLRSRRRCALVVGAVFLVAALLSTLLPPAEYLPPGNRNFIITSARLPPGMSLEAVDRIVDTVQSRYRTIPEVDRVFGVTRTTGPFIGTILKTEHQAEIPRIMKQMRGLIADITQAQVIIAQGSIFQRGIAGGKTIEVEVRGDDIGKIIGFSDEVERFSREVPGVENVRTSLELGNPELRVEFDPHRLEEMGISPRELGEMVLAMLEGRQTGVFRAGGAEKEVDLTVIGPPGLRENPAAIEEIPVWSDGVRTAPLKSFGKVVETTGPTRVDHADLVRAITLTVFVEKEKPLEPVIKALNARLDDSIRPNLPMGYSVRLAGTADDLSRTMDALLGAFIVAVIICYLLMASLFESFAYPFVVIMVVPIGMVGAILGIIATGEQLNVIAMLGFIILAGTVVNNAILIVHQTLNFERSGMKFLTALKESTVTRVRPIMMTTFTSILGMGPLAFGRGSGSELYRGLGSAVLFGLLLATFVILIFTPALFALVSKRAEFER